MVKGKIIVSFSGGKTSGYMSSRLKEEYSDFFDFVFILANTGEELEETLIFADKCDKHFGLNLNWVEAVVNPKHGKGITHKVVTFETASRNGEPFEAFIAKSGIPNATYPQCSDRLKLLPIEHFKKVNGLLGLKHAIGIRSDESNRRSAKPETYNLIYPMLDWFASDKQDVNDFWEAQPFNLEIEPHEGNCKTCWKKSDPKLWLISLEHPERFASFKRWESQYENVKVNANGQRRLFFRKHRSTLNIFQESFEFADQIPALRKRIGLVNLDQDAGCSESCEAY